MPSIVIKKKDEEPAQALVYRFTKKVKQSGVLVEAKNRRFKKRNISRTKRKASAVHRAKKQEELKKLKKFGRL
ncbi:MAG TPA: hypothetical protein VMU70_00730 [Candidatus Tyrphobacter sp.]|nr:hypothetical protein [Candidatus Tyrphobacter sp.]